MAATAEPLDVHVKSYLRHLKKDITKNLEASKRNLLFCRAESRVPLKAKVAVLTGLLSFLQGGGASARPEAEPAEATPLRMKLQDAQRRLRELARRAAVSQKTSEDLKLSFYHSESTIQRQRRTEQEQEATIQKLRSELEEMKVNSASRPGLESSVDQYLHAQLQRVWRTPQQPPECSGCGSEPTCLEERGTTEEHEMELTVEDTIDDKDYTKLSQLEDCFQTPMVELLEMSVLLRLLKENAKLRDTLTQREEQLEVQGQELQRQSEENNTLKVALLQTSEQLELQTPRSRRMPR